MTRQVRVETRTGTVTYREAVHELVCHWEQHPVLVGGVGKGLPTYVPSHPRPPPYGGIPMPPDNFTPTSSSWLNLVERFFRA